MAFLVASFMIFIILERESKVGFVSCAIYLCKLLNLKDNMHEWSARWMKLLYCWAPVAVINWDKSLG